MRRAGAAIVVLAVGVGLYLTVGSGSHQYRVAAIFDTANGMVAGQQVKIAGAVVGSVTATELAPGPKARIVMSIDPRFAPFRANATCTILPEGLISENFVQCDPGTAAQRLATGPGGMPTVPLVHTTVPTTLQDVLNVFSVPTDERIQVLISELGISTAGGGQNFNALLRRTNPALTETRRVLAVIDAQRAQIGQAVYQTDHVLGSLAANDGGVRQFVDRAATVARTTAEHSGSLGATVNRLPAMLAAVRPGLRSIDHAADNATPLLNDLYYAAPVLTRLVHTIPGFAAVAVPGVRALAAATKHGRPALQALVPVVNHLRATTGPLVALSDDLDPLLTSTRDSGGIEGILRSLYSMAAGTALYDDNSHILTINLGLAPACIASQLTALEVTGCSHDYTGPGKGTIPVNDPACGPEQNTWYQAICPIQPIPGPLTLPVALKRSKAVAKASENILSGVDQALVGGKPNVSAMRSLMDFLLK